QRRGMKKHEILSPQSRAALFDPPTDPAAIVRRYTFSPEDSALIRQRRRGVTIVAAMVGYLREHYILLPSPWELERLALAARALARKRAHRNLVEGLSPQTIAGLEAMLVVTDDEDRTPLAWLRDWPEAPRQRNL